MGNKTYTNCLPADFWNKTLRECRNENCLDAYAMLARGFWTCENKDIKGRINCLIKSPEGKIISGGQYSGIKVWDIENKKAELTLEGHTSMIWDISIISKDKLISGSDDNTSKIWNLKDKKSEDFYKGKKQVSSVVVTDNNKVLLASGKNLLLFNMDTKEQISVLDITVWPLLKLKNGKPIRLV